MRNLRERKTGEIPKKENYGDEERWREDVIDYFTGKVVVTREEFDTYMKARYPEWPDCVRIISEEEFELEGRHYTAIVQQLDWIGASPPPTRIFIVKGSRGLQQELLRSKS